jgi:hypothetical protein
LSPIRVDKLTHILLTLLICGLLTTKTERATNENYLKLNSRGTLISFIEHGNDVHLYVLARRTKKCEIEGKANTDDDDDNSHLDDEAG